MAKRPPPIDIRNYRCVDYSQETHKNGGAIIGEREGRGSSTGGALRRPLAAPPPPPPRLYRGPALA
ncbi:hypothetical protein RR48_04796 [Papilio machaon]|uniref:Uncharacterized protein n=1 Tax=Papilio machaon TaxID=76193 RepID=A0A0N1PIB8_PAPMA|nr:hypothetical protein RR48_04796 [Papilio machaon]